MAQRKLQRNRRGVLYRSTPNEYPLTGILYCADCGHKFRGKFNTSNHRSGTKKRWYACNAKQEHNIDCSNPAIKAEDLEPQIFAILETLVQHPDVKTGRVTGLTTQTSGQDETNLQNAKDELEDKLKDNFRKQKENNDARLDNLLAKEVFTNKMIDLRKEEQQIKSQIAKIKVKLLEKERSETYQRTLLRVLENFDKTKEKIDPITKKELIQLIIKSALIKDKKIAKLDLYQPFERYLKGLKCNITQIITRGTEKPYFLLPSAGQWQIYSNAMTRLAEAVVE